LKKLAAGTQQMDFYLNIGHERAEKYSARLMQPMRVPSGCIKAGKNLPFSAHFYQRFVQPTVNNADLQSRA
jgi:hypothetical protein